MCHFRLKRNEKEYKEMVELFKYGIAYSVKKTSRTLDIKNVYNRDEKLFEREQDGIWYSSAYADKKWTEDIVVCDTMLRHIGFHLTSWQGALQIITKQQTIFGLLDPSFVILKVKVIGFRSYGFTGPVGVWRIPSLFCYRYKPLSLIALKDTVVNGMGLPIQFVEAF